MTPDTINLESLEAAAKLSSSEWALSLGHIDDRTMEVDPDTVLALIAVVRAARDMDGFDCENPVIEYDGGPCLVCRSCCLQTAISGFTDNRGD